MKNNNRAESLGKEIVRTFKKFGAEISIVGVTFVSSLFRYIFSIRIAPGTKIQTITSHSEDVQITLGLPFFYVFKDGINISIAVSEYDIMGNSLFQILRSPMFSEEDRKLPYAIGYDLHGAMCIEDLVELRHLLIAGPTGTGKSVALKCILLSLIVSCPVSAVNLLIFDIGANSLSQFKSLPHLSHPIIKDITTALKVLAALVVQMDERLSHDESELNDMPFLVCIIDEFISLIANVTDREDSQILIDFLNNLLRRGRKAKIIMILATQDSTLKNAKVDLGMITNRIAFQTSHHYNSSTALGIVGAEKLPGNGAMLFKSSKGAKFIQGAWVTPEEIEAILANPPTEYDDSNKFVVLESEESPDQMMSRVNFYGSAPIEKDTKLLAEIIIWTLGRETVSARQVAKKFRMRDSRANGFLEELYRMGIIGEKYAKQPRKVLVKSLADLSSEAIQILCKNIPSVAALYDHHDALESETRPAERGFCHERDQYTDA